MVSAKAEWCLELEATYRVDDHGGEDRSGGIVGVELAHQDRDHDDLDEEDDGVQ